MNDVLATERSRVTRTRGVVAAMYVGLALTVITTIAPYVDRSTTHLLADHIRAGYPAYTQAKVDSAVTTYLVLLSVVGALSVAVWLWTTWAVKSGKRWAWLAVAALVVLSASIGLTELLTTDTSGDTGLPAVVGLVALAPGLAALAAVTLMWRRPQAYE